MTRPVVGVARSIYIRPLPEVTHADTSISGRKAANLGELHRAGLPVPEGFVVLTAAFDDFVHINRLSLESPAEAVDAARVPPDISAILRQVAAEYGDTVLAVRSSARSEDMAGASFAGQYETVLNVRGADQLIDAVRTCWLSAFGERVAAYQSNRPNHPLRGMAVLVQRMVAADYAGVAFTANPLTGDRTETLVSAVQGLGDKLVSGEITPEEWSVRDDQVTQRPRDTQKPLLGADQVRAVARLARQVESIFGAPQDIEWAIADNAVFLLQARPITALPSPMPAQTPLTVDVPKGYWERVASHYPRPLSPMHRSIWLPVINDGFHQAGETFGMLAIPEQREIGGWVYMRIAPLGGGDRPPPPSWLLRVLLRVVPSIRARLKQATAAIRDNQRGHFVDQWHHEWRPMLEKRISDLREVDLPTRNDRQLADHLSAVHTLLREGMHIHLLLHSTQALSLGELHFACRDLLGWDERATFALMAGLSDTSTEPAAELARLALLARSRPATQALIAQQHGVSFGRLQDVDAEFADALAAYQHAYGCRALRYEVADPTLAETPDLLLALLRDQIASGYNPTEEARRLANQRVEAVERARQALATRAPAERERFEVALRRAERAYPLREENEFYTVSVPLALVRYALLELGQRLAERGTIAQRDDVFFLEWQEALQTLRQGGNLQAAAARRRSERAWAEHNPGPSAYGTPASGLPDLAIFPAEVRFGLEAMIWANESIFAASRSSHQQTSGPIQGLAASSGTYTGPARIIMHEGEFDKLRPGDVMVCPITSPVWSVLFPHIGALVTDTGGLLSHAAIIAREYRVPAVVATGNATRRLQDGQIVSVDGATGIIEAVA